MAGLTAMGGSDCVGRVLPQCKDGSPRSTVRAWEGGGRLREPNAARRLECPARCGSASQSKLDLHGCDGVHPKAVRQDLSLWARTGEARPWDTFAQRIDDTPPLPPRSSPPLTTTAAKKQKIADLALWSPSGGPRGTARAGGGPRRPRNGPAARGGRRADDALADCAVGSG